MSERVAPRRSRFDFARRRPGRTPLEIIWFDLSESFLRLMLKLCYRFRITGESNVPRKGPCIFICNHQSLLDPIVTGCAVIDRQFTAMAREGLFRFKPLAMLMRSYGSIALKEEGGDTGAFKAAVAELQAGRSILIYPEGSRSDDGAMQDFQAGVALLLRRAQATVVPLGLEGAYEVWPRGQRLPHFTGRIEVEIGQPIGPEMLPKETKALLQLLSERVRELVVRRGDAMMRSGWRPARLAARWQVGTPSASSASPASSDSSTRTRPPRTVNA